MRIDKRFLSVLFFTTLFFNVTSEPSLAKFDGVGDAANPFSIDPSGWNYCYIKNDETTKCEGYGIPYSVVEGINGFGSSKVLQVNTNSSNSCSLNFDLSVNCFGQFGGKTLSQIYQGFTSTSPVSKISNSETNICVLRKTSEMDCYGTVSESPNQSGLIVAPSLSWGSVKEVANNPNFICSLTTNGEVRCLGSVISAATQLPTPLGNEPVWTNAKAIVGSKIGLCSIDSINNLTCIGSLYHTEIKNNVRTRTYSPINIPANLGKVSKVSMDYFGRNICVITASQNLVCWGHSLGLPSVDDPFGYKLSEKPLSLNIKTKVTDVATSQTNTCWVQVEKSSFAGWCTGAYWSKDGKSKDAGGKIGSGSENSPISTSLAMSCFQEICRGWLPSNSKPNEPKYTQQLKFSTSEIPFRNTKFEVTSGAKAIRVTVSNLHPFKNVICPVDIDGKRIGKEDSIGGTFPSKSLENIWSQVFTNIKAGKHTVKISCKLSSKSSQALNVGALAKSHTQTIVVK